MKKIKQNKKKHALILFLGIVVFVLFFLSRASFPILKTEAQNPTNELFGFAWSPNIGWISFNCADAGSCVVSSYKVKLESDNTLSGFAWSPNIGWISFNQADLINCPTGGTTCVAKFTGIGLTGWARACSGSKSTGGTATTCLGFDDANADGADDDGFTGFISLSGSSPNPYAVSYNASSKKFGSFAWGSDVLGWISFNCVDTNSCGTSNYAVTLNSSTVTPPCTTPPCGTGPGGTGGDDTNTPPGGGGGSGPRIYLTAEPTGPSVDSNGFAKSKLSFWASVAGFNSCVASAPANVTGFSGSQSNPPVVPPNSASQFNVSIPAIYANKPVKFDVSCLTADKQSSSSAFAIIVPRIPLPPPEDSPIIWECSKFNKDTKEFNLSVTTSYTKNCTLKRDGDLVSNVTIPDTTIDSSPQTTTVSLNTDFPQTFTLGCYDYSGTTFWTYEPTPKYTETMCTGATGWKTTGGAKKKPKFEEF